MIIYYMGVSKNSGTPKWMVYNGKPYQSMDDLGGKPTIFGNTHIVDSYQIPIPVHFSDEKDLIVLGCFDSVVGRFQVWG